jgi:serine/threonine-protein kinase
VIGRKINNYVITSLLGEGGMGSVYVAEHPMLHRRVAIKVLKPEFAQDKTLVARFMNEARAASAIRQPNIVEVFDVGMLPEGVPYLMMELLEGETLANRLDRDKRLPTPDAVAIACQAATALAAAHAKGIIHRDLKPDNLFLVADGDIPGGTRVMVLDFGIAKLRGEMSTGSVRTHTGSVMGTPPYMSPEQCRGITDDIDHRTDIYALGIILHEMLSGAPPFVSEGFGDLLLMHITRPPTPLRSIDPAIPEAMEAAVLRALQKDQNARFSSMAEMRDALLEGSTGRGAVMAGGTLALEGGGPSPRPSPGGRGEREGNAPRTISTLTSTAGQMLSVEDAAPTGPVSRGKRLVAASLFGIAVVAFAVFMISRGRGVSTEERAVTPTAAEAPTLSAPVPAPPAQEPPSLAGSAPSVAPQPEAASPPDQPSVKPAAPRPDKVLGKREAKRSKTARTSKTSPTPEVAQSSSRAAGVAEPPASSIPPSPTPPPPPAKPKPKLSTEKW